MKILSWNILDGGGRRVQAIAEAVLSEKPEVAVASWPGCFMPPSGPSTPPIPSTIPFSGLQGIYGAEERTGRSRDQCT
ncbi:MAG: hypothetical protein R6T96_00845, partial [Longimicrobiales bacterium]